MLFQVLSASISTILHQHSLCTNFSYLLILNKTSNCYCCSSGAECSPVHVGTVSLDNPSNISATCDLCTGEQCVNTYPVNCVPGVLDPGVDSKGVTIASCDAGSVVDGDPCANAEISCAATEVAMLDGKGKLITATFDLSGLCRSNGYNFRADTLSTAWFNINICGYSPKQCFPADCALDSINGRTWANGPCVSSAVIKLLDSST